jgi:hypothetical protein
VFQNVLQDSISVLEDFDIGVSQHLVADLLKVIVSCGVIPNTVGCVMLATIEFNNEPRFGTAEINDVPSERYLTTEFHAELIPPQRRPQVSFCVRHVSTKEPGYRHECA